MTKPPYKILVTAPLGETSLGELKNMGEVFYDPWIDEKRVRIYSADELAATIKKEKAEILICEADQCFEPVFESGIKVIAACRGAPTNVDIEAATIAGIPVLHTPGRNADAVAEHTLALLFALTRRLLIADREVREGKIFTDTLPYQRHRSYELQDKTFGIVGLGAVGYAVQWRVEALGMKTLTCDPYNDEATSSLPELLKNSDVVSMHAPAVSETFNMMGALEFEACKEKALYINTARASLHDLEALTSALEQGHLAGAGLDHFEGEMLPMDHPILKLDNVILTPHIGGATYNTEERQGKMIVEDLKLLARGQRPLHIANPEVLEKKQ